MTVTLEWYEVSRAATVGMLRHVRALIARRRDAHGFDGPDGWGMHIEGAGGECAVAKALKLYWSGSVDTFKREGDVGDLEVRTRSEDWHELLIRPDDPSAIYVLVVGKIPHFRLVGWIHSSVAKQRNDWLKPHGGRPPAYFVPQSELRPIEELQRRNVYNASPAIDLDTRRHRTLEEGS